ncbi:hypothetical protein AB0D30_00285 [Streptomyces sp. NPDC048409]|jgi:hypothetical protein|uniref:hypothetical protein n=1 Tax=Streptomyces TaxID=1883 RepID=UPI0033272D48
MTSFRKVAVAVAIISGVGFLGAGPASAQVMHGMHGMQGGGCRSHDLNLDVLGEVGILNGLGGNLLNGEGSPGAQGTDIGSDCDRGW